MVPSATPAVLFNISFSSEGYNERKEGHLPGKDRTDASKET